MCTGHEQFVVVHLLCFFFSDNRRHMHAGELGQREEGLL